MSLTENVNRILKARKDSLTRITEKDADCKSEIESVGIDNLRWKDVSGYIDKIKKDSGGNYSNLTDFMLRTSTEITVPDGVEKLRDYLFSNFIKLNVCRIPNSVKKIGVCIFERLGSLKEVIFNGTKLEWYSIEKAANWKANMYSDGTKIVCNDGTIEWRDA